MGSRYPQRPYSTGERSELADRVVRVNRVAKVVKGGRKFSFSALIVVGDLNGRVGAGIGKAREVTEAIRKGMEVAKRNMITVPMVGTTIPHEVRLKLGSARIMLKPAAPGTGVISGGAMRAVIETAGIKDILTKSHGTNNPINTVRATLAALQQLRTAQQVADLRSREVEQIVGRKLASAYRRAEGGAATRPGASPRPAARSPATPLHGVGWSAGTARVEATLASSRRARAASSSRRRVFPSPGSPSTMKTCPRPPLVRSQALSSVASSAPRPSRGGRGRDEAGADATRRPTRAPRIRSINRSVSASMVAPSPKRRSLETLTTA